MFGTNGYQKIRYLGSDVHTFELSRSRNKAIMTYGKKGLETLSDIFKSIPGAAAAINFEFFNLDGSCEGMFRWSEKTTTIVYTKQNKLLLLDAEKLTPAQRSVYEANAQWSAGGGYTIIENGRKSIRHADYSGDAYNRNPRTMLGQLQDGSLIFVVVQGKMKLSAGAVQIAAVNPFNKGMNCEEQYQLMSYLKCVTAVNLDGGGSSELIVDEVVKNKPSEGKERKIGSALVAVRR